MCFPSKSLLVVIGTGTGAMQNVERKIIYRHFLPAGIENCRHFKWV